MNALSWDHNAHYHPLLPRQLPDRHDRVLDVGCGARDLTIHLAARAGPHRLDRARAPVVAGCPLFRRPVLRPRSVLRSADRFALADALGRFVSDTQVSQRSPGGMETCLTITPHRMIAMW